MSKRFRIFIDHSILKYLRYHDDADKCDFKSLAMTSAGGKETKYLSKEQVEFL